jgi:hypothetical protein
MDPTAKRGGDILDDHQDVASRRSGGSFAHADGTHFRVRECDARDRAVFDRLCRFAKNISGNCGRLPERDMRKHSLAGSVAHGPETITGAHIIVYFYESGPFFDLSGLEAERRRVYFSSGRNQNAISGQGVAIGETDAHLPALLFDTIHTGTGAHPNSLGRESRREDRRRLWLLLRQEPILPLDKDDIDTEPGANLAKLASDGTTAQHDQRPGQRFRLHQVVRRPTADVGESWNGRDGRLGAGGNHDSSRRYERFLTDRNRIRTG